MRGGSPGRLCVQPRSSGAPALRAESERPLLESRGRGPNPIQPDEPSTLRLTVAPQALRSLLNRGSYRHTFSEPGDLEQLEMLFARASYR